MPSLFSFLILISCCYVSMNALTDRDIRNNFDDVQTGMGVLLRELLAVMDENEKLSHELNNTSVEFKKLKEQNKKIAHTLKTVKRVVKSVKSNIMKFQDQLITNLTNEQKKMKHELSKFVTNKYAFFAWMVYKLESQNKEQEKIITDLRLESTDHKIKTIKLEKELYVMKKKLNKCEKSIKKSNELMKDKTQEIDELQTSVSVILRKLKDKEKLTASIQKVTQRKKDDKTYTIKHKNLIITQAPVTEHSSTKKTTENPKHQRDKTRDKQKHSTPTNATFPRNYLFTTSYKVNMSDVQPDHFRTAISNYPSNVRSESDVHDMLPQLKEFDSSFTKLKKTDASRSILEALQNINNGSLNGNRKESERQNVILKKKLQEDILVKPSSPLHADKSLVSSNTDRI